MEQQNIKDWGVKETCQYLRKENLDQFEPIFKEKGLTALILRDATLADMAAYGFQNVSQSTKILESFRKLWKSTVQGKVFNDPIHGHMELHPLLIKIIDTPQFQRLRYIKQLGGTYFVYPGASHNRFEHSIGVGYLAGLLAQTLRSKQPYLGITPEDILCVQIAGLCHDLGHGPFSKVFEEMFIPQKRPDWKCKKASADMFDYLMKSNGLEEVMEDYNLDLTKDLEFIKEMIQGPEAAPQGQWPYKGRTEDKSFLYEIVANEKNGIDVVKFDYIVRDCYHLGIPQGFDYSRCLTFARVCKVNTKWRICFRDKELDNLCGMFHTRNYLHKKAYQHQTNKIIEIMISDAFLTADDHIKFEGSEGKKFTISAATDDMEAYTKLTDHVFETILNSSSDLPEVVKILQKELNEEASNPEIKVHNMEEKKQIIDKAVISSERMARARDILQRIISRKIYRYLGEMNAENPTADLINSWKNELAVQGTVDKVTLRPEDLEIVKFNIGHGKQHEDFIKNTYFYTKRDPNQAFQFSRDEVQEHLPKLMSEQFFGVYCKNSDEEVVEAARRHFKEWKEAKQHQKI